MRKLLAIVTVTFLSCWSLGNAEDHHIAQASAAMNGPPIYPNDTLTSPNGAFRMAFQTDCNLVVYAASGEAVWNSQTQRSPRPCFASIQKDGNLVIYEGTDFPGARAIWNSQTQATPYDNYYLVMQDDGNLVVYSGTPYSSGVAIWCSWYGNLRPKPRQKCSSGFIAGSLCKVGALSPQQSQWWDELNANTGHPAEAAASAVIAGLF